MDESKFRVVFSDGNRSKPYTAEQILNATREGKIPASAMVEADGVQVTIAAFRNGDRPTPFIRRRWYPGIAIFIAKCIMIVGVLAMLGTGDGNQPLLLIGATLLAVAGVFLFMFSRWAVDTTSQLNSVIARLHNRQSVETGR